MLELGDAESSTIGAPGKIAKMVAKLAWHERDILALAALVNRQIYKAFRERAVDPVQVSPTLAAITHHRTLYRNLQKQHKPRHNKRSAPHP
jgi:predicted amino acid dehydrogenase